MKRASAIKVVLSCTGLAGEKKIPIPIFSSEIGNISIGGPVNQLIIIKRPKYCRTMM
jgi:hypothetical protein